MKIAPAILLVALGLPACTTTAPVSKRPNLPIVMTPEIAAATESGIRAIMKDPESARFGPMLAVETPERAIFVCGLVNGKNSFGGYTGEKPFFAGLTADLQFQAGSIASDQNSVLAHRMTCRQANLPI